MLGVEGVPVEVLALQLQPKRLVSSGSLQHMSLDGHDAVG